MKRNQRKKRDNITPLFQEERIINLLPKTIKQDKLITNIKSHDISVALGCAGTGKTYCATGMAANLFLKGKYNKIVLVRANVPMGKSIGFFPGSVDEKLTPWLAPMLEVLKEFMGSKFQYSMNKGKIELQPLETIRGRSYNNSIILVDEAQNLTIHELKSITTRLGENSKLILMGDHRQADVDNGQGLLKFCHIAERHNIHIPIVEFGVEDIVRSDIVGQLVKAFHEERI